MRTDSQILFNMITRWRNTTDERLIIDLCADRAAHAEKEISNIALVATGDKIADALTKVNPNDALRDVTATNLLDYPVR